MRSRSRRRPGTNGVVGDQLANRRNLDMRNRLGRQLRGRNELAQRLDLVAPELKPHGSPSRAGEHVDDAAADRELPAMLDHVGARVAELDQALGQRVGRQLAACDEVEGGHRAQRRDQPLHRRQDGRHQDERSGRSSQVRHRGGYGAQGQWN